MSQTPLNRYFQRITLASKSPRRAALLRQIGLDFDVQPSAVEEPEITGKSPEVAVVEIAKAKARAVSEAVEGGLVIGADTTVVLGGQAIGKPHDKAHAVEILRQLSGNVHEVITGVALIDADRRRETAWAETTKVHFRALCEAEIADYVDSGEAADKAGAYGIQGRAAAFVTRVEGCYFNVVGLPLAGLVERLWRWAKP